MGQAQKQLSIKIFVPIVLIAIAWCMEIIDQLIFSGKFNLAMGPGSPFWTIFTAPFSHAGFEHLFANTVAFIPLSYLVLANSLKAYIAVWIFTLLLEIPIWLFWPIGGHGISGIVYALFGYLATIGFIEKRILSILLTIICFFLYGHFLTSLLPWNSPAGTSWVGHFSGFTAGIISAFAISKDDSEKQRI